MLKVLAVTAPHWVRNKKYVSPLSLNSQEPFSLENAIRLAAFLATSGVGEWSKSNWNNYTSLMNSVMFYEYYEDQKDLYLQKLDDIKPNLILIGCMTLGFAGAIQIASLAKKQLGDNTYVVLGGKHVIETTYLVNGNISTNDNCALSLMKMGRIPKVFDLVVSGDGEEIIVEIGNILSKNLNSKPIFSEFKNQLLQAKGEWIIGWIDAEGDIDFVESYNIPLNQNSIPYPIQIFHPKSNFPVFDSDITAHMYSYQSKGCPYDCFFCSEKKSINGKLHNKNRGHIYLIEQLKVFSEYGRELRYDKLSAFVEDSILLGGSKKSLSDFRDLLKNEGLNISIGGQLTIDMIINKEYQKILSSLSEYGLSYLFVGLETNIDTIANQMSKNTNKKLNWMSKTEEALSFMSENNIKCGFSVLFGLGESHIDRMRLLSQLKDWQNKFLTLKVVSLNMATKHPLMFEKNIDYISWGTPENSLYLDLFLELFGEASELYSYDRDKIGSISELIELREKYLELTVKN